jgi:hypothetical protein
LRVRPAIQRAIFCGALGIDVLLYILKLLLHLSIVAPSLFYTYIVRFDEVTRAINGNNTLEWNALAILRWYDYLIGLHAKSVRFQSLTVSGLIKLGQEVLVGRVLVLSDHHSLLHAICTTCNLGAVLLKHHMSLSHLLLRGVRLGQPLALRRPVRGAVCLLFRE